MQTDLSEIPTNALAEQLRLRGATVKLPNEQHAPEDERLRDTDWETYLVSYERAVAKTYPNRNIITPFSTIREHYEAGTSAMVAAESADEKSPTDS